MTGFLFMATWAALACCVVMVGRMVGNERVLGIGVLMALFTCAFMC